MHNGKKVIIYNRPWWRNPVFPWGWFSLTMDGFPDKEVMADGAYKPDDGGGGLFKFSSNPPNLL